MAMIDTCLAARGAFVEATGQYAAGLTRQESLDNLLDALHNDAAADSSGFRSFINCFEGLPAQWALARQILIDSIHPTSVHLTRRGRSEAMTESTARRERVMCDRILALCGGAITGGKPRKRIVAVVGANHAQPLRELLLAAGSMGK